VDKIPLKSCS